MKKILSLVMAVLLCGNAMALDYEPESGLTWQGFVGMTVSNLKGVDMNAKIGVTFGVKAEFMLPNLYGTYINAGLDWTQKGARITEFDPTVGAAGSDVTWKMQAHYIELPIHVGYRYNINEQWGVYADLGPYFAFGVTGKYKVKYEDDLIPDQSEMLFGKHSGQLMAGGNAALDNIRAIQRFDCGFGFRIGAEYNNQYSLNFSYDWGFTDMYLDKYRTAYKTNIGGFGLNKLKNRNMTLTFGYRF